MAALILGIFLLPNLYVWVAGARDVLLEAEVRAGGRVGGRSRIFAVPWVHFASPAPTPTVELPR